MDIQKIIACRKTGIVAQLMFGMAGLPSSGCKEWNVHMTKIVMQPNTFYETLTFSLITQVLNEKPNLERQNLLKKINFDIN